MSLPRTQQATLGPVNWFVVYHKSNLHKITYSEKSSEQLENPGWRTVKKLCNCLITGAGY